MKRVFAIFLTCVFLLGLLPTAALAAEPDTGGLCPHHQEHSYELCGYMEAMEGQPCGHIHGGDCGYVEAAEEIPCDMDCNETGEDSQIIHSEGCAYAPEVEGVPCQHEHDDECGYIPADPGQPCGFVCRICPVQAMIDALPAPEDITPDNRAEVEAQLKAIDTARAGLTDEETGQIDFSRYQSAVGARLIIPNFRIINRFLKIVKKYTEPTSLTPQLLHEFVDKIVVHEADKSSGHRIQRIDVHYNFIGEVDFSPEFRR
jgi:hypothetical protein